MEKRHRRRGDTGWKIIFAASPLPHKSAESVSYTHLQNVKDTVRQIFTEYLHANGHRKTPESYAILDTIYSIDGHFDIDTLYSLMADQETLDVYKRQVLSSER